MEHEDSRTCRWRRRAEESQRVGGGVGGVGEAVKREVRGKGWQSGGRGLRKEGKTQAEEGDQGREEEV